MPPKDEVIQFSSDIENLVQEKDIAYMEAVILYCEERGLEVELAAKLITPLIKAKIREEAEALNFLPKSTETKLPI